MITDELKKMLMWCGKTHAKRESSLGFTEPNDEIYKCIMPSIIKDIIKGTDETDMDEAIMAYLDGYGSYYGGSFWLNELNNKYYFESKF